MTLQTTAWPHGEIKQIFDDIFFVSGINKTVHDGVELQHSRNMIIVREEGKLSLINSVRLTDINGMNLPVYRIDNRWYRSRIGN